MINQKPSNNSVRVKNFSKINSLNDHLSASNTNTIKQTSNNQSNYSYHFHKNQYSSKEKLIRIINHKSFIIVSLICTLFTIFGMDLENFCFDSNADIYLSIALIFVFIFLIGEIILTCLIEEDMYICGFSFCLDCLTCLSLVFDLHWVASLLSTKMMLYTKDKWQLLKQLIKCLRTFTRMIRVINLINHQNISNLNAKHKSTFKFESMLKKRVISLAIIIGIVTNICNPYLFLPNQENIKKYKLSLETFNYFAVDEYLLNHTFNVYVNYYNKTYTPLLYSQIFGLTYQNNQMKLNTLRPLEYLKVVGDCYNSTDSDIGEESDSFFENEDEYIKSNSFETTCCIAIFDNSYYMRIYYLMNICQGFALSLIIIFSLLSFQRSIHILVVDPIKQMALKIKNLSLNPIAALQENLTSLENKEKILPIEISVLINTITKLCGLLILGYGEAGAGIISSVMKDGGGSDLNPMIPGKKVLAIYGFCDIRNFTDTTEVLQEKVMIFVNEVAEIVHSITSDYMGSANKNIGDAFLLVWKFRKKLTYTNKEGELCLVDCTEVHQIVDLALIAFLKIIIQIKKSHKLGKYKKNRLLNSRIPNYRVKLGFGLHVGYSIEGAIGSMYKIDASYLSPNVEKAGDIQECTKNYRQSLILSQQFVDQLGEEARKQVTFLGKHDNDNIYTIELDLSNIKEEKEVAERDGFEDLNLKMEHIKKRKELYKKKFEDCIKHKKDIWKEYAMKDRDIMSCRKKFTKKKNNKKGISSNKDKNYKSNLKDKINEGITNKEK